MLKKIVSIRAIGRFEKCAARGSVEFKKATLIYGDNGSGKSTLCDIFRSLQRGAGDILLGRATLGSTTAPSVQLLLNTGTANFSNGVWSSPYSQIQVYDARFVHENVHAGDYVAHDHKKNLYRVIVGEQGVNLAKNVDALDEEIKVANKAVSKAEGLLQSFVPKGTSLDPFVALVLDSDVEKKLLEQAKLVSALRQTSEILKKAGLVHIALPRYPEGLSDLLSKRLKDVSKAAEDSVRKHLQEHLKEQDQEWLSRGVELIADSSCPFCGQLLTPSKIIDAYQQYFSESYRKLKADVQQMQKRVSAFATEADLIRIEQVSTQNDTASEYWLPLASLSRPTLDLQAVRADLDAARDAAVHAIQKKAANLLEQVMLQPGATGASPIAASAQRLVESYNTVVDTANAAISFKKGQLQAGNLVQAEAELRRLELIKVRGTVPVDVACISYRDALQLKQKLDTAKKTAKDALDKHSNSIFGTYEKRINELLGMFGATFNITKTTGRYVGGTPSSTFQIEINCKPVDLGDANTSAAVPSFSNTLSSGDRSTLALAFFLAQVEQSPSIADKIVVFDDPFNSQDRSRRICTQQQIRKLVGKTRQVIVLSHDPEFLRLVWEDLPKDDRKAIQLAGLGNNTNITEWDIETEVQPDYYLKYELLRKFRDEGDGFPQHVVTGIRPVLEGHLRNRLPHCFKDTEWLGNYIDHIRTADASSPLAGAKDILEELKDLNDYSKRYHHDQKTPSTVPSVDATELRTFVRRTLKLVGGF